MRLWDEYYKLILKKIVLFYTKYFTTKRGFLEKLMKLFIVRTVNIFKNYPIPFFWGRIQIIEYFDLVVQIIYKLLKS
jgi:hypothetical protein